MKRSFSILLLLVCGVSVGYQTKSVVEGQEIHADIAQGGLTRIFVENDRIKDVKSASQHFDLEKDEENGQVYVKPHEGHLDTLVLFLTTETGKTVSLFLEPSNIAAETIQLIIEEQKSPEATLAAMPYEQSLVVFIKAMYERKVLPGYVAEENSCSKDIIIPGLKQKSLVCYKGPAFLGRVVHLKNETNTFISLDPAMLHIPQLRAIAFSTNHLGPNEETIAYLVGVR